MAYIDANYVRANRVLPSSLSSGGSFFSETAGGTGAGPLGGGVVQVCWGRFDSRTSTVVSSSGGRLGPSLGWQVEINPRNSTNRMMVYVQWTGEIDNPWDLTLGVTRRVGGTYTDIASRVGDGSNRNSGIAPPYMTWATTSANNLNSPTCATYWVTDNPNTTSEIQYMPWAKWDAASSTTMYINRTFADANGGNYEAGICTMMVWECSY